MVFQMNIYCILVPFYEVGMACKNKLNLSHWSSLTRLKLRKAAGIQFAYEDLRESEVLWVA